MMVGGRTMRMLTEYEGYARKVLIAYLSDNVITAP
jgi:hypothetical protein